MAAKAEMVRPSSSGEVTSEERGSVGSVRWVYQLRDDVADESYDPAETGPQHSEDVLAMMFGKTVRVVAANEVYVELPGRLDARCLRKLEAIFDEIKLFDKHVCSGGFGDEDDRPQWHLLLPQSEDCRHVAESVAKVFDDARVSWWWSVWLRLTGRGDRVLRAPGGR